MTSPTSSPNGDQIPEWTRGWRLKRALQHGGVTVGDMAKELGVTRQTLTRWMSDVGAPPRPAYMKVWALRCGVPYPWLAGEQGPEVFRYRRMGKRITEMLEARPAGEEITDVETARIIKAVLAEFWDQQRTEDSVTGLTALGLDGEPTVPKARRLRPRSAVWVNTSWDSLGLTG